VNKGGHHAGGPTFTRIRAQALTNAPFGLPQVADFLGTIHHEFTFTVEEGLDALEDLIWHIESFEQVRNISMHAWCLPQHGACCPFGRGRL